MTSEEIREALATLDKAMRDSSNVTPPGPCLDRKGCTCSYCRPGGRR